MTKGLTAAFDGCKFATRPKKEQNHSFSANGAYLENRKEVCSALYVCGEAEKRIRYFYIANKKLRTYQDTAALSVHWAEHLLLLCKQRLLLLKIFCLCKTLLFLRYHQVNCENLIPSRGLQVQLQKEKQRTRINRQQGQKHAEANLLFLS